MQTRGWVGPALVLVLLAAQATAAPSGEGGAEPPRFKLGGALRFSYFHKSWEPQVLNQRRGGEVVFDTIRLMAEGHYEKFSLAAEYRVYSGFSFLRYGYASYSVSEALELQAGVLRAPFGIHPMASNSWFNALAFYVGLEDDYDMGVKALLKSGALRFQLALFKGDEGSFSGRSIDSARYSFDLVRTDDSEFGGQGLVGRRSDRETGQVNAHLTYTFQHSASASTELGLSGQGGGIYNAESQRMGYHWAAAAHLAGRYGPLAVQLEALTYHYRPRGAPTQDSRFIIMGGFDAPFKVASRASMLIANISYTWKLDWEPIDSLTLYNDYGVLLKHEVGYSPSHQNVTGLLVVSGPLYTIIDLGAGRNNPYLGPNLLSALAEGRPDERWGFRLNVNVGYYF